jgi:hypothetical protein
MDLRNTIDALDVPFAQKNTNTQEDKKPNLRNAIDYRDIDSHQESIIEGRSSTNFVGNTGIGKSQYDKNIPFGQIHKLDQIRASRQSGPAQAFNALVGGIGGGILTGLEDVGYIFDWENNINRIRGIEHVESNFFSEFMKENKEALYEHLPIYRKDASKVFDWSDSGFYWEVFRGSLESAVAFGGVGMGAGAAVKGIGAGIRAMAGAGNLARANRLRTWTDLAGKSIADGYAGNITAAAITNFGEGKLMALELYEQAYEKNLENELQDYRNKHNGEDPDAETLKQIQLNVSNDAGIAANSFINRNRAFAAIEFLQLRSLFKATGLTRDIAVKPSLKNLMWAELKNAPKEGLEEIGQNIAQMEGTYETEQRLKDRGVKIDDPISESKSFADRFWEFGLSDQALLEGMMGLISGPIQYTVTKAPFRNAKAEEKRYTDQQATMAKNKEFMKNFLNTVINRGKATKEAEVKQNPLQTEAYKMQEFDALALQNFQRGTTQDLMDQMQDEMNSEENTAEEKEKIKEYISRLEGMEQEYIKYQRYANPVGVFQNRTYYRQHTELIKKIDEQNNQTVAELQQTFEPLLTAYNRTAKEENKTSFSDIVQAIASNDFTGIPVAIRQQIMENPEIGTVIGNNKAIERFESELSGLQNRYNQMTRSDYQLGYSQFENIIADQELTTEEKINKLEELEGNIKGLKNNILKEQVQRQRVSLQQAVKDAKETFEEAQKPATSENEAKVAKQNNKKEPELTPEEQEAKNYIKKTREALILNALAGNADVNEVKKMTDQDIKELLDNASQEELEALLGQYDEYQKMSQEEKDAFLANAPDTDLFIPIDSLPDASTEDDSTISDVEWGGVTQQAEAKTEDIALQGIQEIKIKKDEKSDFTLIVDEDNNVTFKTTGKPVTSQKLINRALLKAKRIPFTKVTVPISKDKTMDYAVTPDGRIFNIDGKNLASSGNEIQENSPTYKKVIDVYNTKESQPVEKPITPTEVSEKEIKKAVEANKTVQVEPNDSSKEVALATNKHDEIEEAFAYNEVTATVNKDRNKAQDADTTKKVSTGVKVEMIYGPTDKFIEWAFSGIDHTGTEVRIQLNPKPIDPTKSKGDPTTAIKANEAKAVFERLKRGEEVSAQEKKDMIDYLPLRLYVPDKTNVAANLYAVRPKPGAEASVKNERDLRINVIATLLEGVDAQVKIQGQYGGDLQLISDDQFDNPAISLPDFKNTNPKDIPLMYVNGEGNLHDSNTRERHPDFQETKVMLKETGKPMAGALFTVITKANGEQFPLKLNIRGLNDNEKSTVLNLFYNLANAEKAGQSLFESTVPPALLKNLDEADRTFLGASPKYKDVLFYLVHEGKRTNSNPVTQLYLDNGILHFGAETVNLKDKLDINLKKEALNDFLDAYKTRSVDLRKLYPKSESYSPAYKAHMFNAGILTTNADTSLPGTVFRAFDIAQSGMTDEQKRSNRYLGGAIYLSTEVDNKPIAKKEKAAEIKPLESKQKPVNLQAGVPVVDASVIANNMESKIQEMGDNMEDTSKIDPEVIASRAEEQASMFDVEEIVKKNEEETNCNKTGKKK